MDCSERKSPNRPRWRIWLLLAGLLALAPACHRQALRDPLEQGRRAFEQGEVLEAYRLLRSQPVERTADQAGQAAGLLAQVTGATEHLVERWLQRAGELVEQGRLGPALDYYDDLIGKLPKGDGLRRMLVERAAPLRKRLAAQRGEQRELVADARREFAAGHVEQARQKLLEARWQAEENHLDFALASERLLEECDRRLPGRLEEVEEPAAPEIAEAPGPASAGRPVTGRRHRRRPAGVRRPRSTPPAAEPAAGASRAEQLYRFGLQLLEDGDKVGAIVTFRRVLARQPDHAGARARLEQLEPFRKKAVEQAMRQAAEHFAREELELAAPFYRRVLKLDPDNLRAKEGLQMYRRLKKLRREQQ